MELSIGMESQYFVKEGSIVRRIWGSSDTILVIFAGAAAEFALNKAVDWLYFTGRLPADPLGRLFSTVEYARDIIFSEEEKAFRSIDAIAAIHKGVEEKRGARIPDWAYRDVLYMLIDYSVKAFEMLERRLTDDEKAELFDVFLRMGSRMGLSNLPQSYALWEQERIVHINENLAYGAYTADLFSRYRQHLGPVRYAIMLQTQKLIIPKRVRQLLRLNYWSWAYPAIGLYKVCRRFKLDRPVKELILPKEYKRQISGLDV
jgi:hypothetical protein